MLRSLRVRGGEARFARARPQEIELVESYRVKQGISGNPWMEYADERTGQIKVTVPYDRRRYFTRQAADDVERVLGVRRRTSGPRSGTFC